MKKFGTNVKWARDNDPRAFGALIYDRTRAIYVESVSAPSYYVSDIPALSRIAHQDEIPLVVDNTLGMGGFLVKLLDLGADIVVDSAGKWIGGHGTVIGGLIVDGGKFDWRRSGKFLAFTIPSEELDGMMDADAFGSAAYASKCRAELLRDVGPLGLNTLSLRSGRHCENALALAQWLEVHPQVAWVTCLGLDSHALVRKLLRAGHFGGMLNFSIKGDALAAAKFVDNLKIASHSVHVGDAKTHVNHPATAAHTRAGIPPDLMRVSVGIEHIDDIIKDFHAAFKIMVWETQKPKL